MPVRYRKLLKRGDKGKLVECLQNALIELGYTLDADGIFGSDTESIVKAFQNQRGLRVA